MANHFINQLINHSLYHCSFYISKRRRARLWSRLFVYTYVDAFLFIWTCLTISNKSSIINVQSISFCGWFMIALMTKLSTSWINSSHATSYQAVDYVKKSNRSLLIIIMIVMIIIIIVLLPSDRLCNPNFLIHLLHLSGVSNLL